MLILVGTDAGASRRLSFLAQLTIIILNIMQLGEFCETVHSAIHMSPSIDIIRKYNVPGPRYTGYPTAPFWDPGEFDSANWKRLLATSFAESNAEGISLYIHLPFCENMCTFCACEKCVTRDHAVENTYIRTVLAEWKMYCRLLGEKPRIRELHLGGGTPTFFSAKHLEDLINGIFCLADRAPDAEFSFEGHPNNTTREHLQTLFALGFRRVSFGVQDYSQKVQKAINRIQPLCNVARVTLWAREFGYHSVSHDVVFGLPFQNLDDITDTIEKTISMRPDRLAFYSYSHVPWHRSDGRRGFADADVPQGEFKRRLYETGREILRQNGYHEVGMDHFALKSDSLYKAYAECSMHRNFMGYCASGTRLTIGLGVSAIGDSWYAFGQNAGNLEDYYQLVEWGQFPVINGHILTPEDLAVRRCILDIMCRFETAIPDCLPADAILRRLREPEVDSLVEIIGSRIRVTEKGKPLVRNICMAFDLRMHRAMPDAPLFSMDA